MSRVHKLVEEWTGKLLTAADTMRGLTACGHSNNAPPSKLNKLWLLAGWVALNMGIFFGLLRVAGLFRVDAKDEEAGLDNSYHGGSAYGDTAGEKTYNYSKVCCAARGCEFGFIYMLAAGCRLSQAKS